MIFRLVGWIKYDWPLIPENPNFCVHFAQNEQDIAEVQSLRYQVFVEELGAHTSESNHILKREIDAFDEFARHLCLRDRNTDQIIGVYRLIDEEHAELRGGYYSAQEYDISPLLAQPGRKLELGRSCVAPAYRGSAAMAMLWAELGRYIEESEISFLFGTASYNGTELLGKRQSLTHLYNHYLAPREMRPSVHLGQDIDMNLVPDDEVDRLYAMRETPALIKAYLRLGGMIGQGAYRDEEFNTIDVLVLMQTSTMIERYKALYTR